MKNSLVGLSKSRSKLAISIVELMVILACVGIIGFLGSAAIQDFFGSFDKAAHAHRYEKVCDVEVYDQDEKCNNIAVTILDKDGERVCSTRTFIEENFIYKASLVDNGFQVVQYSNDYFVQKFLGENLKAGDIATLWKRITTYKVEGQPDIEEVSGYFVGELPKDNKQVIINE